MYFRVKEMHDDWIYKKGDIYLVSLDPVIGSEQGGTRPVVNVQNNTANFYSPLFLGLPITSHIKKEKLPTHILVGREGGLRKDSMIIVEQPRPLDKRRVIGYIGKFSRETMSRVDEALLVSYGIVIPEEMEAP